MMKVLMLQCMEDGDNLVWDKTMCLMCIAKGLQQFIGETDTPKLFYLVQPNFFRTFNVIFVKWSSQKK